jgi:hypothetical protein
MPQRGRGAYDLVIDSGDLLMGFNLAHGAGPNGRSGGPAAVSSEVAAARADQAIVHADIPRTYESLDRGMGYSRGLTGIGNAYSHCLPGFTRSPGGMFCPAGKVTPITLPAPGGWQVDPIVDSFQYGNDIILVNQGPHVLSLPNGDGPAQVVAYGGASFRGFGGAIFNNRLYIGGASGGLMYKDGPTGAWSAPATDVNMAYLRAVNWRPQGVPTDVLVGIDQNSNYSARWCPVTADPMVRSNWSAPLAIGPNATGTDWVNSMVAAPRHVYFLRSDGVWDIDELGTRAFNLAPWIEQSRDGANGHWGLHIGAGMYVGLAQGLAYVPTSGDAQYDPVWCQPGFGLPYEGPVRGEAMAGVQYGGWLLAAFFDNTVGTTSYICAGRADTSAPGHASHVWHGAEALIPGWVTHMKVHTNPPGGGTPRLLIAAWDGNSANPSVQLYWQSLPRIDSAVGDMMRGWGGFVPADAASLFLPADPWDRPSTVKSLLQFDLVTERLSTSDVVSIWSSADGGTMVEQGQADGGSYTQLRPVELTEGRFIQTRIDLAGHPILRSFEQRASVGIDLREARTYTVVVGYDDALKSARSRQDRDPERRLADLRAMLGQVVTLDDGQLQRAKLLQVLPGTRAPVGGGRRAGAWAMTAQITLSILDHPFRYDTWAQWDADRSWS